jgi:hypothetical protein
MRVSQVIASRTPLKIGQPVVFLHPIFVVHFLAWCTRTKECSCNKTMYLDALASYHNSWVPAAIQPGLQ